MTAPPICVVLFLVTYHYLSVHFCDSVQSVSCNCCLDELRFAANKFKPVTFTGKARVALHMYGHINYQFEWLLETSDKNRELLS